MKKSGLSEQGRGLKRTLSGFFLAPLVIAIVLYAPPLWLAIVVAVVIALALDEYIRLTSTEGRAWLLPAGVLTPFIFLYDAGSLLPLFMVAVVLTASTVAIVGRRDFTPAFMGAAKAVFGIVYVGVTVSCIVLFTGFTGGRWLLLCGLLIIWANDIFAYITGRFMGTRRLSPGISPKKTVEGAIGGVAGGVVVALGFNMVVDTGLSIYEIGGAALIIGVVALCGDLFESILKRAAGVKDSGSIIPGHGGMLDRIDSMLFSLPVFYYYIIWRL